MSVINEPKNAGHRAGRLVTAGLAAIGMIAIGCDGGTPDAAKKPAAGGHDHHDHGTSAKPGAIDEHDEHDEHDHGSHTDEVKLTAEAVRVNGIKVDVVTTHRLSATIVAPARVGYNAESIAHVGSAVTGRVAELKARVGNEVKKGDVLLVIDSRELGEAQSEYLQRKTAAATALAAEELARSAYERAQKLYDDNRGISLTDLQARQREFRSVQGEIATTTSAKTAALQRLQLLGVTPADIDALDRSGAINTRYAVRAAIDGRVVEREVTMGELVSPDKAHLLTIADLSTVWFLADVPEGRLGEVAIGAKATAKVAAFGDSGIEGKVGFVSHELDATTRTARVRVEVPNPEMKLRVGMFGQALIQAGAEGEPVIAIPESAVQTIEGKPAVFVPVAGEPNTFVKREVSIGPPVGDMVPVTGGLKAGDRYVSIGSFLLKADLGKSGAAHEH